MEHLRRRAEYGQMKIIVGKFLQSFGLCLALIACISLASHAATHDIHPGGSSSHCGLCHTSSIPAPLSVHSTPPPLHTEAAPNVMEARRFQTPAFCVNLTRGPPAL